MKHSFKAWLILALSATLLFAAEHKELKAFPVAEKGVTRHIIVLPHKDRTEEVRFQVELIAGKTIETDGVNRVQMRTIIVPKPLKGWGYTYYEVTGNDQVLSTMMAAPEGAPKVTQFVGGESKKVRYNSRLPIVVYAPDGFEVKYRIWEAPEEYKMAEQK